MIDLSDIEDAIHAGEFFLEYLPTMRLKDCRCVGAEALIRWRRPFGVIPPCDFIPLVENTPLSGILTYWVIDTVAEELGEWLRDKENTHISINVPPEILGRGGLDYAARKSGLSMVADKLIFEITERGIPDQLGLDAINKVVTQGHGVRVALDDVGAGEVNFVILSRISVNIIKIDKSIVDQIGQEIKSLELLQRVAAMMDCVNIEIIAEGVESQTQAEVLQQVGISMAQGWLFSRPLSARAFQEFFVSHQ